LNYFFRNVETTEEFKGNVAHWLNESLSMCMFSSDDDKDYAQIGRDRPLSPSFSETRAHGAGRSVGTTSGDDLPLLEKLLGS
jgi:hypothetical protein